MAPCLVAVIPPAEAVEGATESANAAAGRAGEADSELAAENWSREHLGRSGKNEIRKSFQIEIEIDIHRSCTAINRDFAGRGNISRCAHRIVNVDNSDGPSRHLRR